MAVKKARMVIEFDFDSSPEYYEGTPAENGDEQARLAFDMGLVNEGKLTIDEFLQGDYEITEADIVEGV